jgi:type II secretory ATPase GspE/PulE/Tfp pilus assembly ATPase PilB-like protein
MLHKILQLTRLSPPQPVSNLRQASTAPLARTAAVVPSKGDNSLSVVESVAQEDVLSARVTSASQIEPWRSIVPDLVRKHDYADCIVLDLSMRTVIVLATPAFYSGGKYASVRHGLSVGGWTIKAERTCTQQVIAEIRLRSDNSDRTAITFDDADNIQLYKDINHGALLLGASDIHIRLNLFSSQSLIRLRIDGKMRNWKKFSTEMLRHAIAAGYQGLSVKGTNSSPTWSTERPISTITSFPEGDKIVRGRLSTQPVTAGCKIVIRVTDATPKPLSEMSFQDLGFTDQQVHEELLPGLSRSHGFIMISGSTGDGKTTTLHRMLSLLPDRDEKNLVGVEDPSELDVPGMEQVSIQRNADDTREQVKLKFDAALLQSLRMDPDVLMQGEVRDYVSGEFAADVVMTGHLWLGTLHGNSALNSIFRLIGDKIQMDAQVLASSENFIMSMSQKLLPLLCKECKRPAEEVMQPQELAQFKSKFRLGTAELFCANTTGCDHCKRGEIKANGEIGRIGAAEIIANPSKEFLKCILNKDEDGAEMIWRKTRRAGFDNPDMRGKTAYEAGVYWVSKGLVSPLALKSVFGKHFTDVTVLELAAPLKEVA